MIEVDFSGLLKQNWKSTKCKKMMHRHSSTLEGTNLHGEIRKVFERERSKGEFMRRTFKQMIAFFLALVLTLSLCACGQKLPVETETGVYHVQSGFSEEAEQSIACLRDRIDSQQTMLGTAYLGYTGESSDEDWMSEVDQSMLQQYPFISEIDAEHTIGSKDYLFCLLPLDENATVSVNLVYWDTRLDNEEIIKVLYRSESGDPVLLFEDCSDDISISKPYIQVRIVDNAGNSCQWYPQLDATGHIVPSLSKNGDYLSFDFTEYWYQDEPSELEQWLGNGYSGVCASELEGCWTIQETAWDTGRTANYYLWFFLEDDMGGSVDLDWHYEGSDLFEEMWTGSWQITSVIEELSYMTITMSLVGGENYGIVDGPYYISETYPILISPSGEKIVIGPGFSDVSLPFMPKYESQLCILMLDSRFAEGPVG